MMFCKIRQEASEVCKTFSQKHNFPAVKKKDGKHCQHFGGMTVGNKESTSLLLLGNTRRIIREAREALLLYQK